MHAEVTELDQWTATMRERLEAERAGHTAHLKELTADPGDANEAHTRAAMISTVRRQLDQVQDALRRIEEGRYGRCERCGKPIPRERLELLPHARYCVPCQQA